MGINKKTIAIAIAALFVATGAYAAGNGSGNPKNDLGYDTKPPAAHFIWKDGKLVPNPKRAESRNDGARFAGK
ncbi:exported hypothetical protein [Pseudomonas veronii]|uniref:hypothetical protein n=1 Tax=Pseudomonas veronii TaxID=76761 RepID=UPI001759174F|nr:hypothetical protein [Pseudomonas veronii]CAD0264184.1 exported hypothetical protein [Pseudomonas veronii]